MKKSTFVNVAIAALVMVAMVGCARQSGKTSGSKTSGLQKIYFDFDQSNVKAESASTMQANAAWLKANTKTNVSVEGHCDERGSYEYNVALGNRRAMSAKSYLTNLGVDGKRLSTISYGEERPAASCNDESCWSQNRRAEFMAK